MYMYHQCFPFLFCLNRYHSWMPAFWINCVYQMISGLSLMLLTLRLVSVYIRTLLCAVLPCCYTPPFCDLLPRKGEGEGVTMRTFTFASQLSPPPLPRIRVLRSMKLCCATEDENSFDWHAVVVLKDVRHVHVHVAIFCKNIAGSLAARLLPPAATAGWRPQETVRDQWKGQDQFSNYFLHAWYTNTTLLHLQHVYTCKNCSTANRLERPAGRGVMEVK